MNHHHMSRSWLATLSIGCLLACSGKLNVGKGTDETPTAGASGSTAKGAGGSSAGNGSGGSAGTLGGSGGSSGGSSGKPAVTKVGNATSCPTALPLTGDSCSLEGAGCGYPASDSMLYTECVCAEWGAGDTRWSCNGNGTSYPSCPASLENGTSCFGHFSTECWYPISIRCNCFQNTGVWECSNTGRPFATPEPPSTIRAESPITQLTDAEREAWCAWYQDAAQGPGFPPVADSEVGPDGRTIASGCQYGYGGPACNVATVLLSPHQCAQNLALSECAAPIGELTDCVKTVYNQCIPSPHGCARFVEAPNCSGTIVSDLSGTVGIGGGPSTAGTSGTGPTGGGDSVPTTGGSDTGTGGTAFEAYPPCSLRVE